MKSLVVEIVDFGEISTCTLEHVATGTPYIVLPVVKIEYGVVSGLPLKKEGVIYIVSPEVAEGVVSWDPWRDDVYIPVQKIKDKKGKTFTYGALARI